MSRFGSATVELLCFGTDFSDFGHGGVFVLDKDKPSIGPADTLARFVNVSMTSNGDLFDQKALKLVLPHLGHPVLSQLVIAYADRLDQEGAELAFRALSSQYFYPNDNRRELLALCTLGEAVSKKERKYSHWGDSV